jgi:hypothetical protein
MTTYGPVTTAKHATLAANVVDVVPLGNTGGLVEVVNRGAAEIYCRCDGVVPTVGGDDCYLVGAGACRLIPTATGATSGPVTVQLISASACAYSVTRN